MPTRTSTSGPTGGPRSCSSPDAGPPDRVGHARAGPPGGRRGPGRDRALGRPPDAPCRGDGRAHRIVHIREVACLFAISVHRNRVAAQRRFDVSRDRILALEGPGNQQMQTAVLRWAVERRASLQSLLLADSLIECMERQLEQMKRAWPSVDEDSFRAIRQVNAEREKS